MRLRHLVFASWIVLGSRVAWATVDESTATVEAQEIPQTTLSEEAETKGVIPVDADTLFSSTQPITPTSTFTEKKPYDQARDELVRALDLWNKGHAEAASDTALEAYDDLMELHRVPGVKRATIRAQMHQAAGVYVEAGIAYVQAYIKRMGNHSEAVAEGRARMEDLRDVAKNYPELNKILNNAINQLYSPPVGKPK